MYNLTRQGTNIPYVKKYDENRELINPIKGTYTTGIGDRTSRRPETHRFKGNGNNFSLTVMPKGKFRRVVQRVIEIDTGKLKNVYHYLTK